MIAALLIAKAKKPEVIVAPEDLQMTTVSLWLAVGAVFVFFALRPGLWQRLFLRRVDPRPAALVRIFFGITLLWTVADLLMWGRFLFTDEGLYLTDMARQRFGDRLRNVWDPEHGFESVPMAIGLLASKWTVLHVRSDPPFVWAIFAVTMGANVAMIVGWRTRLMTFITFLGVMQIYNYSPIWYAGGDTVTRTLIFLGLFCRWGEAYSVDTWRRRKRAILGGATTMPALRTIPVWPQRLMMLQLAIIYCSTGLLKSGSTWGVYGSAIYYAMSLDHFYRMPWTGLTTLLQRSGVLMISTWVVHWWESLFPLLLVGLALRDYETNRAPDSTRPWPFATRGRRRLSWIVLAVGWVAFAFASRIAIVYYYDVKYLPPALELGAQNLSWVVFAMLLLVPTGLVSGYRRLRRRAPTVLAAILPVMFGKRLWLTLGVMMHVGIELSMNVGTFVQVMLAGYPAFMGGKDVDAAWSYLGSRPRAEGTGDAPVTLRARTVAWAQGLRARADAGTLSRSKARWVRARWVQATARWIGRWPLRGVSALVSRRPREPWVIVHAGDTRSMRRAALLRCWDLMGRLSFEASDQVAPESLHLREPGGRQSHGPHAAARLARVLPGLWCIQPWSAAMELLPVGTLTPVRGLLGRVNLWALAQRAP